MLAKSHAYVFYVLRTTFKSAWNDGSEDWKALVVMSIAMGFALIACVSTLSIYLQERVLLPHAKRPFVILWGGIMTGLVVFNHYSLVFNRKWSRFEPEFRHQSKASLIIGGIAVWLSLILIVAAAEWTGSIVSKQLPAMGRSQAIR